ncbi:MAG: MBOAT family protein [Muribaculaceae bacterium]|nr:MBOAT family protein [Muribaculaceae bacterium]
MVFNSIQFLVFLPIVFLLYWLVFKPVKWQNALIVVASYVFYGWWDWRFLTLIALTSLCTYASGVLIERHRDKGKIISAANIVVNLSILGFFKYFNFFTESFADAMMSLGWHCDAPTLNIVLPVGISFYTFQALSYSIDVYRKKLDASHSLLDVMAFISFFPQLVAGPIERATKLLPQIQQPRHFDASEATSGMRQMLWGLFKKMIVADTCGMIVDRLWEDTASQTGFALMLGGVLFAFQIYADFSGYSDIAIGCARLFGINLTTNFKVPYFSRSIREYWRRWHITLMNWFTEYVYFPLGGSRGTKAKTILNTFIVFALSGLWHGANWTYVVWGLYHATWFVPLILLNRGRYKGTVAAGKNLPSLKEAGLMLMTFAIAAFGLIIFRAPSMAELGTYLSTMFSTSLLKVSFGYDIKVALTYCAIMLIVEWIYREKRFALDFGDSPSGIVRHRWVRWTIYVVLFVFTVLMSGLHSNFIYFQF